MSILSSALLAKALALNALLGGIGEAGSSADVLGIGTGFSGGRGSAVTHLSRTGPGGRLGRARTVPIVVAPAARSSAGILYSPQNGGLLMF